jgi:hypothetical protein
MEPSLGYMTIPSYFDSTFISAISAYFRASASFCEDKQAETKRSKAAAWGGIEKDCWGQAMMSSKLQIQHLGNRRIGQQYKFL